MHRRQFLRAAAAGGVASAAGSMLRGGIIGTGGRGQFLMGEFKEVGLEVAAVCDVYEPNLAKGLNGASTGAKAYRNYKELLADKSLQAVVVATPDHWHAQMVIDAVEAGKDVYVEKPMAHTIEDGYRMIEAVRRTGRVVQVGTQRRSFDLFHEARGMMPRLGEVRLVNSWWMNNQGSLRTAKLAGKLDWEQWQGNTPKRPLDELRFFNWYYFWDYSGGLMVGQAAHMVDSIQMLMNSKAPLAVTCAGGRVNLEGAEVPDTTCMCIEYPENYMAVFTLGYKAMHYPFALDQLAQYHGSKARFDVGRESYALYPERPKDPEQKPVEQKSVPGGFLAATRAHIRNFLECIQTRKDPNAPVEVGQATNIVLCMAMESLRRGRRLKWNAASRKVEG